MDRLGVTANEVVFAFLQADSGSIYYNKELNYLRDCLKLAPDINSNGHETSALDNGDLETDGHLPSNITVSMQDIHPIVDLHIPRNHGQAAVHEVARALEEIAAQFEDRVVAQATRNLSNNILNSASSQWKAHLTSEVERVLRHGVGLEHLPQEKVIIALALTLVKRVCMQAPVLLRDLFRTAVQYINPEGGLWR